MKKFTLEEIAAACGGKYVGDENLKSTAISSVERDSRCIKENSLFLAIKGERVDGHDFIENAMLTALSALFAKKRRRTRQSRIFLLTQHLRRLKNRYGLPQKFDIPVVGVSGSVGKTSTKEMLYAVLSQKYKTHKTQGNLNNELGVPLTLLAMPEDTEAAVIEMGISDFGEMSRLAQMVQPTVCVLTIIGCCHLENLGDRNGVLKAKTEMFKFASENAEFVLNGDDDKLSTVTEVNGKKPIFFGLDRKNDYYAENIQNNADGGVLADLCFGDTKLSVKIPAIGSYMVSNALAAVAVGKLCGLNDEQLIKGVQAYKTVGSRANVINTEDYKIIDDCYNANPTSVMASIDTLVNFSGRTVAILGDMKELGTNELEMHRKTGEHAKEKGVDLVIAVGPLAKALAEGSGGKWYADIDSLLPDLKSLLKKGDTVLVKASHSMQFERIVAFLKG